jgi:hypothetical protein
VKGARRNQEKFSLETATESENEERKSNFELVARENHERRSGREICGARDDRGRPQLVELEQY